MRHSLLLTLLIMGISFSSCAQEIPNKSEQISAALMAAPEDQRAEAKVLGFDAKGNIVTLREGTNALICLADDPNRKGFGVACYHKDLEAFMSRGRALKSEGKDPGEIFNIREEEAKAGTLKMPEQATTLHLLEGENGRFDAESGTVVDAQYRYVVYIPWATGESSGLPTKPVVPGGPWLMNPGTHRAHIMISTPPQQP